MSTTIVFDLRRDNLVKLIDHWLESKRFETGKAICDYFGLEPTYIAQLLNSKRQIGEKAARELEQKLGIESLCLDRQDFIISDAIQPQIPVFEMHIIDAELFQLKTYTSAMQIPEFLHLQNKQYVIVVNSKVYQPCFKLGDLLVLSREQTIQQQDRVCVYFKNGYQLLMQYLDQDLIYQHFQSLDGKRKVSFERTDIEHLHRIQAIIVS